MTALRNSNSLLKTLLVVISSEPQASREICSFNRFLHFATLCVASVEMTMGLFYKAKF